MPLSKQQVEQVGQGYQWIGMTVYKDGAEIPVNVEYRCLIIFAPFIAMLMGLAYFDDEVDYTFVNAVGSILIFGLGFMFNQKLKRETKPSFIFSAIAGVLGYFVLLNAALYFTTKSFHDFSYYSHLMPTLVYASLSIVIKHLVIDLMGAGKDEKRYRKIGLVYTFSTIAIYATIGLYLFVQA